MNRHQLGSCLLFLTIILGVAILVFWFSVGMLGAGKLNDIAGFYDLIIIFSPITFIIMLAGGVTLFFSAKIGRKISVAGLYSSLIIMGAAFLEILCILNDDFLKGGRPYDSDLVVFNLPIIIVLFGSYFLLRRISKLK